jgi:hypothetical protein
VNGFLSLGALGIMFARKETAVLMENGYLDDFILHFHLPLLLFLCSSHCSGINLSNRPPRPNGFTVSAFPPVHSESTEPKYRYPCNFHNFIWISIVLLLFLTINTSLLKIGQSSRSFCNCSLPNNFCRLCTGTLCGLRIPTTRVANSGGPSGT